MSYDVNNNVQRSDPATTSLIATANLEARKDEAETRTAAAAREGLSHPFDASEGDPNIQRFVEGLNLLRDAHLLTPENYHLLIVQDDHRLPEVVAGLRNLDVPHLLTQENYHLLTQNAHDPVAADHPDGN